MKKVDVVSVQVIRANIPKKMLCKCSVEHKPIDQKTYIKISRKMSQIENAIHMLQNVQSVVEKIQNRWIPGCPLGGFDIKNSHTC
jgi:hypothetical protein